MLTTFGEWCSLDTLMRLESWLLKEHLQELWLKKIKAIRTVIGNLSTEKLGQNPNPMISQAWKTWNIIKHLSNQKNGLSRLQWQWPYFHTFFQLEGSIGIRVLSGFWIQPARMFHMDVFCHLARLGVCQTWSQKSVIGKVELLLSFVCHSSIIYIIYIWRWCVMQDVICAKTKIWDRIVDGLNAKRRNLEIKSWDDDISHASWDLISIEFSAVECTNNYTPIFWFCVMTQLLCCKGFSRNLFTKPLFWMAGSKISMDASYIIDFS